MCNTVVHLGTKVSATQFIAIVPTSDGLVHFMPLDQHSSTYPEEQARVANNCKVEACTFTRELVNWNTEGELTFYGAQDICGPITIREAQKIPELVEAGYKTVPPVFRTFPAAPLRFDLGRGEGLLDQPVYDPSNILHRLSINSTPRALVGPVPGTTPGMLEEEAGAM